MKTYCSENLLGRPSWTALFQALPASVGMQAIPVIRAKEGMISHHILINRQRSAMVSIFTQLHLLTQLEWSHIEYLRNPELQCLNSDVDILDHMRGCHWAAQAQNVVRQRTFEVSGYNLSLILS